MGILLKTSSVLSPKLLFSNEKPRNFEKFLSNFNLEVPTSCTEKYIVIKRDFQSNSEKISSSLEIWNQCLSEDISQ